MYELQMTCNDSQFKHINNVFNHAPDMNEIS